MKIIEERTRDVKKYFMNYLFGESLSLEAFKKIFELLLNSEARLFSLMQHHLILNYMGL